MAQQAAIGSTQATLGEVVAATEGAQTSVREPSTHAELIEASRQHARETATEHFPEVDIDEIEWRVSTKATESAGACKPTETGVDIRLTWGAYKEFGWEKFAGTVRHELIHAYEYLIFGESSHGARFKMLAKKLDTHVHCERFTEPKFWVFCPEEECDFRVGRQKRSKTVTQPGEYLCGQCDSPLESKRNPDH